MKTLREILESENPVAILKKMDADGTLGTVDATLSGLRMKPLRGVHHKDNLTHSISVLANAIEREGDNPDLILRTAALLHDIGKPDTRRVHAGRSVTFDGHEIVGERIVKRLLPRHGYTKSETNAVAELVRFHMRSHGFEENGTWTRSAVRRLMSDVSTVRQLERLIVIFYADVTTKHDSKRARIHAQVARLVEKMNEVTALDARAAMRPAMNGNEIMELFGLKPGAELGAIMKFLNSDEGIALHRDDIEREVRARFF